MKYFFQLTPRKAITGTKSRIDLIYTQEIKNAETTIHQQFHADRYPRYPL